MLSQETMNPVFVLAAIASSMPLIILCRRLSASYRNKTTNTAYRRLLVSMKDVLLPHTDVQVLLRERANSNQRLVRALQISNTFVSEDPLVHKEFVGQAQHLLNGAKHRGWTHFQKIALDAVEWELSHQQDNCLAPRPFDSFVQNVSLLVVLTGLLQVEQPIESISRRDVTIVANHITTLWALSKRQERIPSHFLSDLTKHLRRLVPDEVKFPNPLNFVVPAWETLWRVVGTTVAHSANDDEIRKVFKTFNESPCDHTFRGKGQLPGIDVKCVVSEAMRLYPPSKRIGRSRKNMWCPSFIYNWFGMGIMDTKKYANVEELLCCDIWGSDAKEFKPSRHQQQCGLPKHKEALTFVFGYGPLRCIASSWAPMAAAVISGAILDQLDAERYTLEAGRAIGGRDGWVGWSIIKTKK